MRRIMVLGVALALLLAGGALAAQTTDTAGLVGTVWQWQGTQMSDDSAFTPDDPANYTIEFMTDGSIAIQADCNQANASYTLDSGALTVIAGPTTLMACPEGSLGSDFLAQLSIAGSFFLQEGDLFIDLQADSGTMHFAPAEPALVGTVWQWQGTQMSDDSAFTPADPASYTVEFMADGGVAIQADCNSVRASYTLDGSAITITPGPATLMACPEGSLGSEFLAQLNNAAIYFFQDGELFMDIKFDSGTLRFAAQPPALVGPVWLWQSTQMGDGAVTAPDNPNMYSLQFSDSGLVSIQADCNRASAAYTLDGSTITITPGPTTLMACPEGSLGGDFLEQLNNAAIYFFQDGDLFLDIKFDGGTMRFVAQPSGLAGTTWVVTGYNNGQQAVVSLLTGTEITAEFAADGRLSGSASCNTYNTSYTTTADGGFSVGPVAATRMLCSTPEGIMEQEQAFIAALESAATYQVRGDTLEMRTADDALALMLVARAQ